MLGFCRPIIVASLTSLLIVACGKGDSGPLPSPTVNAEVFETHKCRFDEPRNVAVECGTLTVPADYDDPDGDEVELAVAIFRSRSRNPEPDPIVYLHGGPGAPVLETIALQFPQLVDPFLDHRDFIVFDQRGAGLSRPRLRCPNLDEEEALDDEGNLTVQAVEECREHLVESDFDPGLVTSAASASDLEELRRALGYESWNMYGTSYGTRLALTAMRDHPDGIRSVILDSTYPIEESFTKSGPSSLDRALRQLFDDCAADTRCRATFYGLDRDFAGVVSQLNDEPIALDWFGDPTEEVDSIALTLTGDLFVRAVRLALYAGPLAPLIPRLIDDAQHDYYYDLFTILGYSNATEEQLSTGVFLSNECSEDISFVTREDIEHEMEEHPTISGAFSGMYGPAIVDVCETWDVPKADDIENQPVESSIPTLILAGNYDPATPPAWGRQVAETLEEAYFFELPGVGHGVIPSSGCAEYIARTFLDDPEHDPASPCLDNLEPSDLTAYPFE